jgi:ActR/RegA family two-component response regulator
MLLKPARSAKLMGVVAGERTNSRQVGSTRIMTLEEIESEHITRTLALFRGNVSLTAGALGLPRRTLQRKLARLRTAMQCRRDS